MNNQFNRRDFLKMSTAAVGGLALGGLSPNKSSAQTTQSSKTIRLGFVGVGNRGSYHLDCALGIEGVEVPAVCDINEERVNRAKQWVEEAGQPAPRLYGRTDTDFERLCQEEELDAIICSTSWKWHAQVCLAAMKTDKHAVSEVPIIQTLDEAWALVETHEATGKWATLGLEGLGDLNLLNMVRHGCFGDIIHAEGGYIHDLRNVKFNPEEEPWRLQHSIDRNGNLYPDHPMARIMPHLDINHGDRIDYLVSMSSKAVMLNRYAKLYYGPDHPYATTEMKQGDYNATLIRTVGGKMVTLNFDTNTPHPRGLYRLQGTKGVYISGRGLGGAKVYFDGISPQSHQWEPADKYLQEMQHPVLKNYNPPPRKAIRGHGGGESRTPIRWHRLIVALREGKMTDWDVYDSVTSSSISPVTEMSVAGGSKPVEFPDFTKGKWQTSPPVNPV